MNMTRICVAASICQNAFQTEFDRIILPMSLDFQKNTKNSSKNAKEKNPRTLERHFLF